RVAEVSTQSGPKPQNRWRSKGSALGGFQRKRFTVVDDNKRALQAATEFYEVRFDQTRAASGSNGAVVTTLPRRFVVVAGAHRERIHAVSWDLNAIEPISPRPRAVVADGDGGQGIAAGEAVVKHGRPCVDIVIFDRRIRTHTEIDKIVFLLDEDAVD